MSDCATLLDRLRVGMSMCGAIHGLPGIYPCTDILHLTFVGNAARLRSIKAGQASLHIFGLLPSPSGHTVVRGCATQTICFVQPSPLALCAFNWSLPQDHHYPSASSRSNTRTIRPDDKSRFQALEMLVKPLPRASSAFNLFCHRLLTHITRVAKGHFV